MSSYFGLQVLFLYFRTSHFSVSIPHFGSTLILRPINQLINQTNIVLLCVCVRSLTCAARRRRAEEEETAITSADISEVSSSYQ